MNAARMGSLADATMAAMMEGDVARRLRDEELARQIGKALARNRPTLDDVTQFAASARRDNRVDPPVDVRVDPPVDVRVDAPVDGRVEKPWGAFEKKRAASEGQRAAMFGAAATTPRAPSIAPAVVAPPTRRRLVSWPWIFAATIATSAAVQLAVPEFWPAVGQRAMEGVDWLRDTMRDRQSHDAPTLPVAVSSIAPADVETPTFVPMPMPVVITTTPAIIPLSAATPPPPPPLPEPVITPRPWAAKPRAQARPIARTTAPAAVDGATEPTTDAPITEPNTTSEQTAMAEPTPKPTPLQDPPRDTPAIQEPPPPESPPDEAPDIREPPPVEVPTPTSTEGATAQ